MTRTGDVGELDARSVGSSGERVPVTDGADPALIGCEQALTGFASRALRGRVASVDVSWSAGSATVGAERVA
jgi:hypothetical protein